MRNPAIASATILGNPMLADSLEVIGFQVILAEDSESGLSALKSSSPDVLLLNFAMPGMSGAEMADRVRLSQPELPIVFASGYPKRC